MLQGSYFKILKQLYVVKTYLNIYLCIFKTLDKNTFKLY